MKLFSTYKTVAKPWGGANNFQRALFEALHTQYGVVLTEDMEKADIIFMNQLSTGPGKQSKHLGLRDIEQFKKLAPKAALVIRAVNLQSHSYPTSKLKYWLGGAKYRDEITLSALNSADFVIFQSEYQRQVFRHSGYRKNRNGIIHNGASKLFSSAEIRPTLESDDKLTLFSSSLAKRETKRQDLILELSELPDVNVIHAGLWPNNLAKGNIEFCGVLDHLELSKTMSRAHYFFHPATKDPCPNALIEGLHLGLPVLFNPEQGSSEELAGKYGVPIKVGKLTQAIREARQQYKKLTHDLIRARTYFGVDRAAAQYFRTFQHALRLKSDG